MEQQENNRLIKAENALQCSNDKHSAQDAIHEYFAAKAETKETKETK